MNKRLEADKYLVVEQKGWRVVTIGLSLALIFSLTFKAVFSPRRIQYEIERVLSAADPRISTSAEGAHLSLSDGVWPRLAIVIDKLKINTADPCIHQVKANIENLEMPIAFSSLLNRNLIFKRIEVGLINIEMKAKRGDCSEGGTNKVINPSENETVLKEPLDAKNSTLETPANNATTATATATEATTSTAESMHSVQQISPISPLSDSHSTTATASISNSDSLNPNGTQSKTSTVKRSLESPPLVQTMSLESKLLQHIVLHEVHLQLIEWPQFQWNLKEIDVHLPATENEKTQVDGMISLASTLKESADSARLSFQGINAKVYAKIDKNTVEAKIQGAWREGRIEVEGQWNTKSQNFNWNGSFKQIPWGQIVVLAESLGKADSLPISSQAWVSTNVDWSHSSVAPEHFELNNTQIEGEFGDFILGKVIVDRSLDGSDWVISPYKALLKEINVDILAKLLGWEGRYPAFNKFGIFDGEAQYQENQLVDLSGELKNIKIIFSGKGRNQLQTINSVQLKINGKASEWSGVLTNIDLEGGQWNGDIKIDVDQSSKTVRFDTEFSEVKLNQDIEEMMTMNGRLSPLEGKLNLEFSNGRAKNIKGFLKSDQVVINKFNLDKARVDFEGEGDHIDGKIHIQDVVAPRNHLDYWPQSLPENIEELKVKNIVGNFNQSLMGITIKDLQGSLIDLKSRFIFEASADNKDQIQGQLQIRGDRNKNQNYTLSGTRRSPKWTN